MQLAPVRTAAPAQLPVSVADAKSALKITGSDDDTLIESLIGVATAYLDGYSGILGRALITQTWAIDVGGPNYNWDYRAFNLCRRLRLPLRPVQSISAVTYWDGSNVSQTFPSPSYSLLSDSQGSYLYLGNGYSWPGVYARPDALRVSFIAGYGNNSSDVPAPIRQAIILMVNQLRSLSTRDQNVMVENVIGVGSTTYATGRDSGVDALTGAAQALLASYRLT